MVGGPWLQASSCKSLISPFHNSQNFVHYLPTKPSKKLCQVKASSGPSGGAGRNPSSSPRGRNPLALVLEVPGTIWKQTLRPLSDFAFGRKSIWEGGIGLFTVSGAALLALTLVWLRGFHVRSRFRKYHAVFEFSQACGICVGTPVRIRGVTVGSVVGVNSSLKSIDATVEIEALAENIQPLLIEVRDNALLKDVESLTKTLADATEDLRKMESALSTPENGELIRQSIFAFIFTLKNIESISSDISGFTGDEAARLNLKLLIKSLSRLL